MRIRHLVLTDAFAGVERHVCVLANEQVRLGYAVQVWGGDPAGMRARLDRAVSFRPAQFVLGAAHRVLTGGGVDVLHAHMTKAETAALLGRGWRRTPIVATRHFAAPRAQGRGGVLARPMLGRAIAAQIAISRYVADAIDGPSHIVYPGVAPAPAATATRAPRPVALVVQRLQPEKNTDVAIRAFATGAPSDWRLEVVGHGSESGSLRSLATELGVADRVSFLGFRDDVPELMAASSVLLAPCEVEGLGLSVLEAMAHGLPVVASRAGAHPETVGRAEDAQLFTPGDWREAGALLGGLAADSDARRRYGSQLARVQQQSFTPQAQAAATDEVYREVLG